MRRTWQLVGGIALLLGCRAEPIPTATARVPAEPAANRTAAASVEEDLATLRRVTAPFHEFANAERAGWSAQITPCMTDPGGAGGMGFHYGKPDLIDGSASVDAPELLLYEPESNGRLRLVAVEYIIPYTAHSRDASPPVLFGREFQRNDTFQLWGLHAWVWKHNPSGMFANWNPRVTCEHTTHSSAMSHQ